MAFTWTKELETGNAQIDQEHQSLIQALNELLAACAAGKGRSELGKTLDFLENYTKTHFQHEEMLQVRYRYPDYAAHKQYHAGFVKVVQELSARLKADGPSIQLVGEINQQLGGWLVNHIKREDVKVAKHIQAQGK